MCNGLESNWRLEWETWDAYRYEAGERLLAEVNAQPHVRFIKQFVQALGTPVRGCFLTDAERAVLRRGGRQIPYALQSRFIDRWHEGGLPQDAACGASLIKHGFDRQLIESWGDRPFAIVDRDWSLPTNTPTLGDLRWLSESRRRALADLLACKALNVLGSDALDPGPRRFLQAGRMGEI